MARVKAYRKTPRRVLAIIISVMLSIGAIFGVGAVVATVEEETQKTISVFEFKQGGLNSSGVYFDDNSYIYTGDAFSCDGLEIEIDFENDIEYKVYFYKQDWSFIESTNWLRTNYSLCNIDKDGNIVSNVEGARYCRIVIQPVSDESVAFYEVLNYAKQLTIKVNKVQFPEVDIESSSSTSGTN